jgi:hypothetical protein
MPIMSDYLTSLFARLDRAEQTTREIGACWSRAGAVLESTPIEGGGVLIAPAYVLDQLRAVHAEITAAIARCEAMIGQWPTPDDWTAVRVAGRAAAQANGAELRS